MHAGPWDLPDQIRFPHKLVVGVFFGSPVPARLASTISRSVGLLADIAIVVLMETRGSVADLQSLPPLHRYFGGKSLTRGARRVWPWEGFGCPFNNLSIRIIVGHSAH